MEATQHQTPVADAGDAPPGVEAPPPAVDASAPRSEIEPKPSESRPRRRKTDPPAELPALDDGDVEAVIFSLGRPTGPERLAVALGATSADAGEGKPGPMPAGWERAVAASIDRLNAVYESSGRSFRIEHVAGGYRVMTLPRHAPALARLHQERSAGKLTKPAVETLAIIAYRQPITRAKLEAIRGVSCGEVLKTLLERRLITVSGRAEELGRPMLYATTRQFLDAFGLSSLRDLPAPGELGA